LDRVASIRLVVFLSPLFDLRGWEKNVPASSRGDLNLFKYLNTNSTAPQLCTIPEKIEGSSEGAALAAFRLFGWPILRTAPESERQRNTIASQTKPILLLHSIRCILAKKYTMSEKEGTLKMSVVAGRVGTGCSGKDVGERATFSGGNVSADSQ
jgi:hypothetical protein